MLNNKVLSYQIKCFVKEIKKIDFDSFVLGIDVGGTNTTIGVAGVKDKKTQLLFSLTYDSKQLNSMVPAINETLDYAKDKYDVEIDSACIAAAGAVSNNHDYVKLTNASWDISTNEILKNTLLKSAFIINDFQAIGYGINFLDYNNKKDIFTVKSGDKTNKTTKAIIGAGTGLGKSILIYDEKFDIYIPIPSEGGHTDFPAYDSFEQELVDYVKKLRNIKQTLTYEELLSGRGLESIYMFLKDLGKYEKSKLTKEIEDSNDKSVLISKCKNQDKICAETFRIFTRFYGRCAKNFVLDSLATGGLYIAGGIASKNIEIFSTDDFLNEFKNAYRKMDILEKIPIYVIVNYDVSLYGACFAAIYLKNLG